MMDVLRVTICIWLLVKEIYATEPIVEIEQGKLRGNVLYDINGDEFCSFRSIPYASKPIGDLRFKAPQSPEAWSGILDATEDLPLCSQWDWTGNLVGQEDCLYLNVHTPKISTEVLIPVMFYIHGGGFVDGSGRHEMYGPEFLIAEGVVLVTINYRLGLFGFLNFENPSVGAPGNAGLKDQNMALRWVRKNIAKFGGNPNSVTIFGDSAGAASVHMHVLSPMSNGLFNRAIAQSGTALNTWNNGITNTGVVVAKALGFESPDDAETLKFLRNLPAEKIMKVQENFIMIIPVHEPSMVGFVVEAPSNEPAFLTDTPKNLIEAGNFPKMPFILGYTNAEALVMEVFYAIKYEKRPFPLTNVIPYDLNANSEEQKLEILEKIKQFYKIDENNSLLDVESDAWVTTGVHASIKSHAKQQHTYLYFYVFSADTKLNYVKRLNLKTSKLKGASHMDDLGYLFRNKYTPNIKDGSPLKRSMERVLKLWTNFAKFGNPNEGSSFDVIWDTVTGTEMNYLEIGTDSLQRGVGHFEDRVKFWDELYENYKRHDPIADKTRINTEL